MQPKHNLSPQSADWARYVNLENKHLKTQVAQLTQRVTQLEKTVQSLVKKG